MGKNATVAIAIVLCVLVVIADSAHMMTQCLSLASARSSSKPEQKLSVYA